MADGKRKFSGDLAAWHVAMICARMPFTAVALDPMAINPYRSGKPSGKSSAMAELEKWQSRRMWAAMYGTKKEG